jgi:excisionase family DNA binding protein
MQPPAADGDVDLLSIAEICRRCGLGRSYIYEAIRRGELRARKYGRLTRILLQDYQDWLMAAPPIAPVVAVQPAPPPVAAERRSPRTPAGGASHGLRPLPRWAMGPGAGTKEAAGERAAPVSR